MIDQTYTLIFNYLNYSYIVFFFHHKKGGDYNSR